MPDVVLAPCLLCQRTDSLTVRATPDPFFPCEPVPPEGTTPRAGWDVSCTACALRGPWRASETGAREAWNDHNGLCDRAKE